MTMPRKSPNMMSTTGRMPVIAAPTPMPVMPASEMGESMMRLGPNSSTRPLRTLKGVPASAISSPMMNTVGSRRSSSASASRIAWLRVIWRIPAPVGALLAARLDVDIFGYLRRVWVGRFERELHARLHLGGHFGANGVQFGACRDVLAFEPGLHQRQGIALATPEFLFLAWAIVGPLDVTDMMAIVAIGLAEQERWPFTSSTGMPKAAARALSEPAAVSV